MESLSCLSRQPSSIAYPTLPPFLSTLVHLPVFLFYPLLCVLVVFISHSLHSDHLSKSTRVPHCPPGEPLGVTLLLLFVIEEGCVTQRRRNGERPVGRALPGRLQSSLTSPSVQNPREGETGPKRSKGFPAALESENRTQGQN